MRLKHFIRKSLVVCITLIFFSSFLNVKNCTKETTTEKDKTGKITKVTIKIIPCDNPDCPVKKNGF